jgi:hypothetical protein
MIRVILLGIACVTMIWVRATTPFPIFDPWWWVWIIGTVTFAFLWGWVSARHFEHKRRTSGR